MNINDFKEFEIENTKVIIGCTGGMTFEQMVHSVSSSITGVSMGDFAQK